MDPVLHLSIPVRDLDEALAFYEGALGCGRGRRRESWADVWFFGLQLTLQHRRHEVLAPELVGTRHFGVTLDSELLDEVLDRLLACGVAWQQRPVVEHAGTVEQQRKAKVLDPSGNVIELKSYADAAQALVRPA